MIEPKRLLVSTAITVVVFSIIGAFIAFVYWMASLPGWTGAAVMVVLALVVVAVAIYSALGDMQ